MFSSPQGRATWGQFITAKYLYIFVLVSIKKMKTHTQRMLLYHGSLNYYLLRNWLCWGYVAVENTRSGARWQDINLTHYLDDFGQVMCLFCNMGIKIVSAIHCHFED